MTKKVIRVFGRNEYLLGEDHEGIRYYLEEPFLVSKTQSNNLNQSSSSLKTTTPKKAPTTMQSMKPVGKQDIKLKGESPFSFVQEHHHTIAMHGQELQKVPDSYVKAVATSQQHIRVSDCDPGGRLISCVVGC